LVVLYVFEEMLGKMLEYVLDGVWLWCEMRLVVISFIGNFFLMLMDGFDFVWLVKF